MYPHISLNSFHSSASLPPLSILLTELLCSFNAIFLLGSVVLLPFPHALPALLQRCTAKTWAVVLGQEWGWGPARGCQEGSRHFAPSAFVVFSMPDTKWAEK